MIGRWTREESEEREDSAVSLITGRSRCEVGGVVGVGVVLCRWGVGNVGVPKPGVVAPLANMGCMGVCGTLCG